MMRVPGRLIYFTPHELTDLEGSYTSIADEATQELGRRYALGQLPDVGSPRWYDNNA